MPSARRLPSLPDGSLPEEPLQDGDGDAGFRVLVEAMSEGAAILQRGVVVYANPRLAEMLRGPHEAVVGASVRRLFAPEDGAVLEELLARADRGACDAEATLSGPWRGRLPVRLSLRPMVHHGEPAVCALFTDLSERERAAEQLRLLSTRDELTGLANRRGLVTMSEQLTKVARRAGGELFLFYIDLDGLKPINDRLGHVAGDRALADAAALLRTTFRETDVVARLGGDEFAVLAAAAPGLQPEALVERLHAQVADHNARAGRPYRIDLSVGWVRHDASSPCDLGDLLRRADEVMYVEKRRHHRALGQE
ncbi:MAG: diguanylate cyclase [Anaeromyxobacter sp.]